MLLKIKDFSTIIFDCDGVILDSNQVKTEAFRKTLAKYKKANVDKFINYHINNGGISRYKKFEHFFLEIEKKDPLQFLDNTLSDFSEHVIGGLLSCDINPALKILKETYPLQKWAVASGGDQEELREVFYKRSIDKYFDLGIYGSPAPKEELVKRILRKTNDERSKILFIGDSKYDFEVAKDFELKFLFVEEWSEYGEWRIHKGEKNFFHTFELSSIK